MKTRMLGADFGVEAMGLDPSRPISEHDCEELRGLLDRHQLLLLRCGALEAAAQIRFVEIFAPIFDEARDQRLHSYVSNVIGEFPQTHLLFHHDYAYTPWPHRVVSLYAQELVGDTVPTLFASNIRAFARLTAAQRAAWSSLTAVHARDASLPLDVEYIRIRLRDLADGDDKHRYPRAEHPVLLNHPRTGVPMLFINEYYTSHIPQLPPEAGERLIMEACALLYEPAGIFTHEWQLGDLVVWDNIAVQHGRAAVDPASRRTLQRVVANDHIAEPAFVEHRQRLNSSRAALRPRH